MQLVSSQRIATILKYFKESWIRGLDLIEKIHAYLMQDLSNDPVPLPILTQKLRDGNLGMKTGQGIYEWNDLDSQRLIENVIHRLSISLNSLNTWRGNEAKGLSSGTHIHRGNRVASTDHGMCCPVDVKRNRSASQRRRATGL